MYNGDEDNAAHEARFNTNAAHIAEHNTKGESLQLGLNQFTDLS